MNSFKLQDEIYNLFVNDYELMSLMGDPFDDEEMNLRFRREEFDITEIDSEAFPFLTILFWDTAETRNYLRNVGLLEITIYSLGRYDASRIFERIRMLFRKHYPEMKLTAEGQIYTEVRGMYCYRTRFNPLINS
jgi:hypothetical protein